VNKKQLHLVVVGGGAAGFFCAVNAARLSPGLLVTIVEKSSKLLQKVKVSGGGRCNVTHKSNSISDMSKCYPRGERFVKKSFHRFFVHDTIEWFAARGVPLKAEADDRMFPTTDDSQTIIDCLLREANQYKVELQLNFPVQSFQLTQEGFTIFSTGERKLSADFLCIASGGFPKPYMFDWITQPTGHIIASPIPSLFTFNLPGHPITQLMGVATPALVKIAGLKWESTGALLITHWGLSGPAVLRLSAFAARDLHERNYEYTVIVNWLPTFNEATLRAKMLEHREMRGTQKVMNTEWINIPSRLWSFLLKECVIDEEARWATLPAAQQNQLIKKLCGYEMKAKGKTTFKDEFVTAGGIDTSEIGTDTMASKKMANLFFAGEILNVDGITGGYNFQHAWTSGFAAAHGIAQAASLCF